MAGDARRCGNHTVGVAELRQRNGLPDDSCVADRTVIRRLDVVGQLGRELAGIDRRGAVVTGKAGRARHNWVGVVQHRGNPGTIARVAAGAGVRGVDVGRGGRTLAQGFSCRCQVLAIMAGHTIGHGGGLRVIEGGGLEQRQHFVVAAVAGIGCCIMRHCLADSIGAVVA